MIFYVIQFKNNKTFIKQIKIPSRIEQVVKFPSFIIRPEYVEEVVDIKILFFHIVVGKNSCKLIPQVFIKAVKTRKDGWDGFQLFIVKSEGVGQSNVFTTLKCFIVLFP
ncbi:hypothetical protein D3C80_1228140 [compost metagenome]